MKALLTLLFAAALLGGCATPSGETTSGWLPGSLTCLQDSVVLPFKIQRAYAYGGSGGAGVAASNPQTGEQFTGQYVAIIKAPSLYQATANLIGDQSNVIELNFTIRAGWRPHGTGTGKDNRGRKYQLQF